MNTANRKKRTNQQTRLLMRQNLMMLQNAVKWEEAVKWNNWKSGSVQRWRPHPLGIRRGCQQSWRWCSRTPQLRCRRCPHCRPQTSAPLPGSLLSGCHSLGAPPGGANKEEHAECWNRACVHHKSTTGSAAEAQLCELAAFHFPVNKIKISCCHEIPTINCKYCNICRVHTHF